MQTKQCSAANIRQIIPTMVFMKINVQVTVCIIQQRSQKSRYHIFHKNRVFKCYRKKITRCTVVMRILSPCLKRALRRMPMPTTTTESAVVTKDRPPVQLLTATTAAAVERVFQRRRRSAWSLRRIGRPRRR